MLESNESNNSISVTVVVQSAGTSSPPPQPPPGQSPPITTGTPPQVALSLNQSSFKPGDTHILTAAVTPGNSALLVDAYLELQVPNQPLLFYQSDGSLTLDVQPLVRNWPVAPYSGEIARYTFNGTEPAGTYTWSADFTAPGTQNIVGNIAQAQFTFTVASQTAQPPHITLLGDNPLLLTQGCPLAGAGATAIDAEDGDLTNSIIVTGSVDINAPGQYFLTYSVTDSSGLSDVKTRQVVVFRVIGTPVCFVGKPAGKAPNLIVIVHGCCTDENGVKELDDLGRLIAGKIQDIGMWEIVVWDWHTDTPKRDFDPPRCPKRLSRRL